ncbi:MULTISPECIES: DNA mismatch repair endonuclease MutL [unclassified Nitrospina]|uniref:DNA mismatch repair endonuclease MutL n=1 Tax=unclassified Nitrospina TaxID=2638683 RepID=UPI003F9647F5
MSASQAVQAATLLARQPGPGAMTIQILPDNLANQIAAGEVVERPASVVKELVENAIDAGATRIAIEVEGAGKESITVRDNGCGMNPDDARLALARHATSKISQPGDLVSIRTLGFRGEALPSIASVARVRLTTCHAEGQAGTEVTVEGGDASTVKETACPKGTTVEVRQLFFNTPARHKFLRRDQTEAGYITQVVQQQALAHPGIQFSLSHNGRTVVNTLPTDQVLYRIAELFGPELTRELLRVEKQEGRYRIEGYISSPILTRSKRDDQFSFINHRHIRDKVILSATQKGYSHLLPRGQHPVLFLYFTMDPDLLDVNVHPAKAEVRFAYQSEVYRFVMEAIQEALAGNEKSGLPEQKPFAPSESAGPGAVPHVANGASTETYTSVPRPHLERGPAGPPPRYQQTHSFQEMGQALQSFYGKGEGHGSVPPGSLPPEIDLFRTKPRAVSDMIYSDFEPLGQLNNSFIVMQGRRGVLVVDQHIAHERVLYERFKKAAMERKVEIQNLLFPLAIEFAPAEAEALAGELPELARLGLEMEAFGTNGFLLRSVPAILKAHDHEAVVREIAAALARDEAQHSLQDKYDDVIIMMSCRNAIKVNHPMELDQIRKLLHDLEMTEMPYTCPHGRPIALLFDIEDILKQFHRK